MNLAVSPRDLTMRCDPPETFGAPLILGMPHLSLGGLSETWLMKELGHRHWQMLASLAGRAVPDFRDADGAPVYAAFCAASLCDAALDTLSEHDRLTIASSLVRASRTQFVSRHELTSSGRPVGRMELCSVFVKRAVPGRNRSAARLSLDLFPEPARVEPADTAALAARMRAGNWDRHFGFLRADADAAVPTRRLVIRPCPRQDFNGAEFLYFASFQALVDRAEWELLGEAAQAMPTLARDIVFYGNIEIGERIAIDVLAVHEAPGRFAHWCRISRMADGERLADVFTRKGTAD
ncbi:hypothetical protein MKI84_06365 [Ancylobacter sp. A5.8]|uniref:Pnap_2097 family protein n=1 Tax=Ancylobacter gelatini TaxID=2919920 RepID=UPI001F4EC487|nr:Pnap_2097 family protein [Ancylobacter gelatini]MCJ8142536.1 hypothetical protein [Ancylobacter gelatini]